MPPSHVSAKVGKIVRMDLFNADTDRTIGSSMFDGPKGCGIRYKVSVRRLDARNIARALRGAKSTRTFAEHDTRMTSLGYDW